MSTEEPTDDLSKPLGQKPKKRKRFVVPLPLVTRGIAGVLGLCVAVFLGWILFVDEPFGGEPMVVVSADTRASPQPAKAGQAPQAPAPTVQKPDAVAPPTALADGDKPSGAKTVTIIDGTTGKRQEVTVAQPGSPPATKAAPPAPGSTPGRTSRSTRGCWKIRATARSRRSRPTAHGLRKPMRARSSRRPAAPTSRALRS